jgi:hypothetical protein
VQRLPECGCGIVTSAANMSESEIKHAIDPEETEPWLAPIGKLVINFGALELETYFWIDVLSEGTEINWALKQLFKPRAKKILQLLPDKINDATLRSEVADAWKEALRIAKFRNSILHSPLVFGYSTADESGPPDIICMPDVRQLRESAPARRIAKLVDINAAVNQIVPCATRLEELRRLVSSSAVSKKI